METKEQTDAIEKVKTAEQKAVEAKQREAEALKAAAEAREEARKAESVLRDVLLTGKKDSATKGTVDLWPLLYLPDAELAERVTAGGCDGVLTELLGMAEAHPRHAADGAVEKRGTVIEAIKARLKKK